MQLPRDQSSASGRARAAIKVAEEELYFSSAVSAPHRVTTSARSGSSGGLMHWPKTPNRSQYDRSVSGGNCRSGAPHTGRHPLQELPKGPSCGSFSWSPPRTRRGMFSGSSTAGSTTDPESRGKENVYGGLWLDPHMTRVGPTLPNASAGIGDCSGRLHQPRFPLMNSFDPYGGARAVARAGTLVSRKDAATVERSSRRAFLAIRRASQARVSTETSSDEHLSSTSIRGHRRRRYNRNIGKCRGRRAWVTGSGAGGNRERGAGGLLKRLLPTMERVDRELHAIRKADSAMKKEQLAQVSESQGKWGAGGNSQNDPISMQFTHYC